MKYAVPAALTIAFLFSAEAIAETYITYDDGGVYTLSDDESVYVADRDVFIKRTPATGDVNFEKQDPFTDVDYQEPPVVVTPGNEPVGSHEWCLAFEPWASGLTFDQVAFNYSCDTNRDNKYGCGDVQFDASEEGDVCSP
jgi:hypothetical protein